MSAQAWTGATPAGELVALLADGAVKTTVVLLAALLVERGLRRCSASVRHAVLATGLLGAPLVVAATAALHPESLWFEGLPTQIATALAWVYFFGVGATLTPLVRGLIALGRLSRRATEAPWLIDLGTEGGPRLLQADVAVPMTFGWPRPVVFFPPSAQQWTDQELHSALTHELGHIRRGDWPVLLLSHLALALAWFHPLAWRVRRRMLLAAEQAADDAVLALGVTPSAYASHLLKRCAELRLLRPAAVTMSPMHPRLLESRVRAILAPQQARGASRAAVVLAVLVSAFLMLPLASASVVSQPVPPPPTCNPTVVAAK